MKAFGIALSCLTVLSVCALLSAADPPAKKPAAPAADAAQPAATKPAAQAQQPGPRVVARNLDNPSGIAIHPETGHWFVAERRGVVRFYMDAEKKRQRVNEITGFPVDKYGKGPIYDIGPLGVGFLDEGHLIVADGSRVDTEEVILVFDIEETPPTTPQDVGDAEYTLGPLASSEENKPEGNYYGVAVTKDAIYSTANGDDTKGWVVRSKIENGDPGELERFLATKEAVNVDAPVAITTNKEGQLVVGQMGEVNVPGDSLLTIYEADGTLVAKYDTGLSDITGLAYSPATGKLYATDFAWADSKQGGLFELTISGEKVTTRKVAELDKPTAIAFNKQGHAFITVFGTAEEGAKGKPGQIIRFGKTDL